MFTDPLPSGTILIVDDNPGNLDVLFTHLDQTGFDVLVAENGEGALERVNHARIDLILLDVMMPGIDGFETCRRLKQNEETREIPIIFMTALSDTDSKIKGFEVGAVDYVTKPYQYEEVLARITTHLTLRNLQTSLRQHNLELQQEIQEHEKSRNALRKAHDELEKRVVERTEELSHTNAALRQEIHERKQAEENLQASETHFRQVITSISDHVYATKITEHERWINLYISPNIETLTGYPFQQFIDDWRFWNTTVIHPDDRALASAQASSLAEGQSSEAEYRLTSACGDLIWVRDSARVEWDGPARVIYGVVSDITVRKQAETMLREHAERLKVLRDIDQGILTAQSSHAIARAVLHNILHLVSCQQTSMTLFDFETQEVLVFAESANPNSQFGVRNKISLDAFGNVIDLRQGQTRLVKDLLRLDNPSSVEKLMIDEGLRSFVSIPFIARGELIGSLNLGAVAPDSFGIEHIDIARGVANQLTVAIMQTRLFEAEARRRQEAEALRDTATALNSTLDLEEVLEQILANVGRVVPHDAANMMLVEGNIAQAIGGWGYADPELEEIARSLSVTITETPHLIQMAKSGQPLTVHDTKTGHDWKLNWHWVRSYTGVPICLSQRVIGFINLASATPNYFTVTRTKHLQAFADQAAVAIENARLHTQTQAQARKLAALNKAGQAMTSTLDLNAVLELVMSEANAIVGAEGTAVLLSDSIKEELVFAAAVSPGAKTLIGKRVPMKSSIAGWVVQEKQATLIEDAQHDPRFYNHIDTATGLTTRSVVAVPLISRHEVIGVIEATNNRIKGIFNQRDLELMEALASSAAIAIENARLFEQVQAGRERLRRLTHQVVTAHEEERHRLSHELHDEAGQVLTALKIGLGLIRSDLPPEAEALRERLSETVAMTDMTMERLRALARDLRPPALDAAGLNPTLEGLCREFAGWTQLSVDYTGTNVNSLSDPVKISLYRFLQEALTNVAKHAQADQIQVELEINDRLVSLRVQDDGGGFNRQTILDITDRPKSVGLLGMRERLELLGGWLEIETSPGQGACLIAIIPLDDT